MNNSIVIQNHELVSPGRCCPGGTFLMDVIPQTGNWDTLPDKTIQLFGFKNTSEQPAYTCFLTRALDTNPNLTTLSFHKNANVVWFLRKTSMYYYTLMLQSFARVSKVGVIQVDNRETILGMNWARLSSGDYISAEGAVYFDRYIGYRFQFPTAHTGSHSNSSINGIDRIRYGSPDFDKEEKE